MDRLCGGALYGQIEAEFAIMVLSVEKIQLINREQVRSCRMIL